MLDPTQAFAIARQYYGDARCGWPIEQVEELRILARQALSASQIADKMGRTRNSIIGKCDRMGIALLGARFNQGSGQSQKIKNKVERRFKRRYTQERVSIRKELAFLSEAAEPVESLNVSLLDLQDFHCRAVSGETDDNCLPTYCGHPVVYGSYCSAHAKVNFTWRRR